MVRLNIELQLDAAIRTLLALIGWPASISCTFWTQVDADVEQTCPCGASNMGNASGRTDCPHPVISLLPVSEDFSSSLPLTIATLDVSVPRARFSDW